MMKRWNGVSLACMLLCAIAVEAADEGKPMAITLYDFSSPEQGEAWITVNDVVMGGMSRSRFAVNEDTTATFAGTVSLENNGGFASVRTIPRDHGMDGCHALRLRVRGDGHIYQFRIRMDDDFDGVAYQAAFETRRDEWVEVELPLADFAATWRGRRVPGADPVDPARVRQVGFLIAEKQEGPFALQIDWIRAIGIDVD